MLFCGIFPEKKDTVITIGLDEIVISSQRFAKPKRKITQQIETISKKEIEFQNFQTTADILGNNFGNPNQTTRLEKVAVYGINSDFKTKIGSGDFIYGADVYYDNLNSLGTKKNINTGVESITDSR